MKKLALALVMVFAICATTTAADLGRGRKGLQNAADINQCPSSDLAGIYCKHVSQTAFNAIGAPAMREIPLGKIIGVAYTGGYWQYIIKDGGGYVFTRRCREIETKW